MRRTPVYGRVRPPGPISTARGPLRPASSTPRPPSTGALRRLDVLAADTLRSACTVGAFSSLAFVPVSAAVDLGPATVFTSSLSITSVLFAVLTGATLGRSLDQQDMLVRAVAGEVAALEHAWVAAATLRRTGRRREVRPRAVLRSSVS